MGKGSSQPSSSTVTQTSLPAYAQPYYERLMSRTESESLQPYATYGAPRLADFSQDQQTAFQGVRNLQAPGQLQWASDRAQQAANYNPQFTPANFSSGYTPGTFNAQHNPQQFQNSYEAGSINPNYQAGNFSGGEWNRQRANQYMDPYLSGVLSQQQNLAMDRFTEQQRQRDTAAVNAGAFGGSRATIANEVARRGMNEQLNQMQQQALSGAYTTGQQAFASDMGRGLQAQQLGEQSRQYGAGLGLQSYQAQEQARQAQAGLGLQGQQYQQQAQQFGDTLGFQGFQANQQAAQQAAQLGLSAQQYAELSRQFGGNLGIQNQQLGLQAAQTGAGLGQTQQSLDLARLSALSGAGQQQQALDQRSLDIGYQDFINQRDNDRNQLQFYSGLLHGTPVAPNTTSSVYGSPTSSAQNLVGLGLAGYGAYRAMS